MQTQREMTEPIGGETKEIDWQRGCDELLGDFNRLATDLPPTAKGQVNAFQEKLIWTLAHAPVPESAKYHATTTAGGGTTY